MGFLQRYRMRGLEKRVVKEGIGLSKDIRRVLAKHHARIPPATQTLLAEATTRLENACANGDGEAVRAGLTELEILADDHLGFARKSMTREYSESIGIAVMVALVLRMFALEAFKIPSGSMIPTLEIGDHIFVNKVAYGLRLPGTLSKIVEWGAPERGEVIVFINPCEPDKDFIKRIIATEGDTVEVRCDVPYVNGVALETEMISSSGKSCSYWDYDEYARFQPWQQEVCSRYKEGFEDVSYNLSLIHI